MNNIKVTYDEDGYILLCNYSTDEFMSLTIEEAEKLIKNIQSCIKKNKI